MFEPEGHAHHVWVKQTKRLTSWMIRLFFCSTVAFAIPVQELLSIEAFLKGAVMGIGPCVATKVLCAVYMGKARFVIGWAMVGRAEFAYLIAQMGAAGNMITKKTFSILIWALLWATIFAPFVFRYVLNKYIRENNIQVGAKGGHGGHDEHKVGLTDDEADHKNPDSIDTTDIKLDMDPVKPKALGNSTEGANKPWDEDLLESTKGWNPASKKKNAIRKISADTSDAQTCCANFLKF